MNDIFQTVINGPDFLYPRIEKPGDNGSSSLFYIPSKTDRFIVGFRLVKDKTIKEQYFDKMKGSSQLKSQEQVELRRSFGSSIIDRDKFRSVIEEESEGQSYKHSTIEEEILIFDFYGVENDRNHFDLIYNTICQKIYNEVAKKCSVIMKRLTEFSLQSTIGRRIATKKLDFLLRYRIPKMSDFANFHALIAQNFTLKIKVTQKEEDELILSKRIVNPINSAFGLGGLTRLIASPSNYMFVFSQNDESKGWLGSALTLITFINPCFDLGYYKLFRAIDGTYMNLAPIESTTCSNVLYENDTFEINTKCIDNIKYFQHVQGDQILENSDNSSDEVIFEVRTIGDLDKQQLLEFIGSTLKSSYLEMAIDTWMHLLFIENNNLFKTKFDPTKWIEGIKLIRESPNCPSLLNYQKVKLCFELNDFFLSYLSSIYSEVKNTLSIIYKDLTSIEYHIVNGKCLSTFDEALIEMMNLSDASNDLQDFTYHYCLIVGKNPKFELSNIQKKSSETRDIISEDKNENIPDFVRIPPRRSYALLSVSREEVVFHTYNIKENKFTQLRKVFNLIKNQSIYSGLREAVILNLAKVDEVKSLDEFLKSQTLLNRIKMNFQLINEAPAKAQFNRFREQTQETDWYASEGGLSQIIIELINIDCIESKERQLSWRTEDLRNISKIAEFLRGLIKFMRSFISNKYCIYEEPEEDSWFEAQRVALKNIEINRDVYNEVLKDQRIKSLLTESVEDKLACFEIVKSYCQQSKSFSLPLYYFEKEYMELQKGNYPLDIAEFNDLRTTIDKVNLKFKANRISTTFLITSLIWN